MNAGVIGLGYAYNPSTRETETEAGVCWPADLVEGKVQVLRIPASKDDRMEQHEKDSQELPLASMCICKSEQISVQIHPTPHTIYIKMHIGMHINMPMNFLWIRSNS